MGVITEYCSHVVCMKNVLACRILIKAELHCTGLHILVPIKTSLPFITTTVFRKELADLVVSRLPVKKRPVAS